MKSEVVSDSIDHISKEAIENSATSLIPNGSVLIVVRSGILARTVPIAITGCDLTINQDLKALCPNGAVAARFLYHLLESRNDELLSMVSRGATVHRLMTEQIRALDFILPPLPEQYRIVDILDNAFEGIATAKANTENNIQMTRELFTSALEAALRSSSTANRRSDSELGPTRSDSRDLESLLIPGRKISYGIVKPGRHDPDGIRLIKSQQVRDNAMDLSGDFRITRALDEEYSRTRLKGGEILLNLVGASIGRSAIAPAELKGANVSRAIAVIPARPELSAWIQYNLRGPVGQQLIQSSTGGSAQPVLNLSEVKRLTMPFPPLGEQQAIVGRLDALSEQAARLGSLYERKVAALEALKKSLLHQAFTGQL